MRSSSGGKTRGSTWTEKSEEHLVTGVGGASDKASLPIQHHNCPLCRVSQARRESSPCRNDNRFTYPIQSDLVEGGQSLHAGDAGNDVKLKTKFPTSSHLIENSERTVVERWVTPHQESTALVLSDHLFIDQSSQFAPQNDTVDRLRKLLPLAFPPILLKVRLRCQSLLKMHLSLYSLYPNRICIENLYRAFPEYRRQLV